MNTETFPFPEGGCSIVPFSSEDKYDIRTFAHDDISRFLSFVQYLNPRDQEIIILFAILQKRPTDLSILFGKAGHRAEEDLHKAAHKLAGLIEFGPNPTIDQLERVLAKVGLHSFNRRTLGACIWQYARCRDFREMSRLIGSRGLRQEMLRVFKRLHAAEGSDEGLLAGWVLWLVDGSNPRGKGWRARKLRSRERKLGPMVFHTYGAGVTELQEARTATERGGRGQRTSNVKIKRHMKFVLRGINA